MSDITLSLFIDALQTGAIKLDLNPIVTADEHDVVAFEGVLRSDHPAMSDPARIVHSAAQYNMVDDLADKVFEQARAWLDRLPTRIGFMIDLHPFEVVDTDAVMRRLASLGEPTDRVIARLPHPGMLLDIPNCDETVRQVQAAGFQLAIGSAVSAFAVMPFAIQMPVQFVEVEPGFATGIAQDDARLAHFDRIVKFARRKQAQVLVQGVTTTNEIEALREHGADLFAGEMFEVEYGSDE